MIATRTYSYFMPLAAACVTACGVMASEYHGTVTTSGLPVPGVTVTATQLENRVVTTTDERGQFTFAELPDGTWTLVVEMLGFATLTREVGVAHDAPPPQFSLKILSEAAMLATFESSRQAPAIAISTTPPAPATQAAPRSSPAGARPTLQPQELFSG